MENQRKCECGSEDVVGVESNGVKGCFDENGTLCLKAGEPLGIEDLQCRECGKSVGDDFEIEFC